MSRKIYIIIAMVFTVVLSVSTFFIIRNHIDSAKQNEVYDNLAEIVEDEPPKENEGVTFSEDKDYLAEYLELYRQNEDMVGWIKVEDTNINYPVVQPGTRLLPLGFRAGARDSRPRTARCAPARAFGTRRCGCSGRRPERCCPCRRPDG